MHLGEIIYNYRKIHKLSMDDFSSLSGLSKSYISMLEKNYNPSTGKNIAPTVDAIKKVSVATNIDFNKLFSMLESEEISLENISYTNHDETVTPIENIIFDDYFPLHYSTNLSAGTLEELLDSDPDAVVYVPIKYQLMKKRLHAFKVNGSSMNNVIEDGSIVIAEDVSNTLTSLKDGTIVVAFIDGQATVKRLYVNGSSVTLMPDSKDKSHQPIIINSDDTGVAIIGRVIWHMNPDDMEKYY